VPGLKSWIRRGMEMLLCVALVFATAAQAARTEGDAPPSVPIAQLVARAKEYDGKILTVEGEAIGDLMERGNHAWVNLLEDGVAIGVWLTEEQTSQIHELGRYGNSGDLIQVRGTFHRACPDHGGDLDMHAAAIQILRRGSKKTVEAKPGRLAAGIGLCILGGLLALIWRRRERKTAGS
jgi:hypothetical protein